MAYSYLRRNTSKMYWGNSACKIAKASKFLCPLMAIYALMKMALTLIKRYTAPWLALYLCASRPDIMLSVCMCARFQATPKESHHKAMKHILRYLAHTPTLGLWYPKGSAFDLIGYSDSGYPGDRVDRKSTSDTCHFLRRSLVYWYFTKHLILLTQTILLST